MRRSRIALLAVGCLLAAPLLASCKGGKEQGAVATPPEQAKAQAGMQSHKMGEPLSAEELAKMKAGVAERSPGN